MIELPIYKKYLDAILELKKPFELRHKPIKKGTIVKLEEITEGENCDDKTINLNFVARILIGKEMNGKPLYNCSFEEMHKLDKYIDGTIEQKRKELIKEGGYYHTGRYIIFESGNCFPITNIDDEEKGVNPFDYDIECFPKPCSLSSIRKDYGGLSDSDGYIDQRFSGYDNFCGDYINEKQTYLIEIAKIIEVKGND